MTAVRSLELPKSPHVSHGQQPKKNVQDKRLSPRIPSQSAKNCWRVAVYFDLIGLFIYHFQDNCHFKISFFFNLYTRIIFYMQL